MGAIFRTQSLKPAAGQEIARFRELLRQARAQKPAPLAEPELARKFVLPRGTHTYRGFQTAAGGLAAEAESRKELLLKHGLAEEVLSGLQVALDQFEAAAEQGAAGRLTHIGATAELERVSDEAVQIVRVMTGLIRVRFAGQPELLVEWERASNVVAAPKSEQKPDTSEVRTAACSAGSQYRNTRSPARVGLGGAFPYRAKPGFSCLP